MPRQPPKFDDVQITKLTTVKGGLLKKPMSLPVLSARFDGAEMEFVHMTSKQDWLCKAVTGACVSTRPLGRVSFLKTLAAKIYGATAGLDEDGDDAAEDQNSSCDPMSAFAFEEDQNKPSQHENSKPKTPRATIKKNCVLRLRMPDKCQERFPGNSATRDVTCFVKSKREVWLGVEHLPWAINYMHDQFVLGGVPIQTSPSITTASSSAGNVSPSTGSSDGSPSLHWDFAAAAWVAFSERDGPRKQRMLRPVDVQLDEASTVVGVSSLDGLPYADLKNIAAQILLKWSGC